MIEAAAVPGCAFVASGMWDYAQQRGKKASSGGVEPTTSAFGGRRSIQLSYEDLNGPTYDQASSVEPIPNAADRCNLSPLSFRSLPAIPANPSRETATPATAHAPAADEDGAATAGPAAVIAPRWVVLTVTWANSLGSGLLWGGVPFVMELQYGFTKGENLLLALAESIIYVVVALGSGPVLRRFAGHGLTPRAALMSIFIVQLVASGVALTGMWGVVLASCVFSAVGAALWPMMESYVSSGQHGGNMRRSIGIFNVTWMSATGAALLLMAPVIAFGHASHTLFALAPISILSMVLLRWFPARPAAHPPEHAHTHIAPQYAYLLRATRFVIPTSYIFISVIGPVLPFILRDLVIADELKTPIASLWMFARMFTVVILAQLTFWHGRWSTLAVGISLLAGGFAGIVLATDVSMLLIGLTLFGAGHGILYYAGLYYAMAVGGADVDAGGRFEALIGVGYVIGPVAGMLAGGTQAQLVGATWAAALLGIAPAIMPWLAWRRRLRGEQRAHA